MSLIRKHGAVLQAWACLALVEVVEVRSCKISSSWAQRFMSYLVHRLFLLYLAMVKNPKIRSCDLDL